jgi:hypothetical protein
MRTPNAPLAAALRDKNGNFLTSTDQIHTEWFANHHHYCQLYNGMVFKQHREHFGETTHWEQSN